LWDWAGEIYESCLGAAVLDQVKQGKYGQRKGISNDIPTNKPPTMAVSLVHYCPVSTVSSYQIGDHSLERLDTQEFNSLYVAADLMASKKVSVMTYPPITPYHGSYHWS